ncbi:flavin-containing amine oxidoreductase-domain containing protein [Clohesyomyces aquaticus]|uniref:Flavin-containing amine oxidoreductase-domain containing protein n=1 Tax=Clohesyomyces aquaticus TaxID=1231657 RepID=A0A1Y1ZFS5_9PLEO|nr:flavin-containing amine oxidoreductase-domain containing protein [Clohesyomyces aquaticus]
MFSTLAATNDDDALNGTALPSPFLFSPHHDDVLSISMSHESALIKPHGPTAVPISALNNLAYGQYSESTPSSTHNGDVSDLFETNGSHMSSREDRDGSISSGLVNGHERSHAPSPLHISNGLQHPHLNGTVSEANSIGSAKQNGPKSIARTANGITAAPSSTSSRKSKLHMFNHNQMTRSPTEMGWDAKFSSTPELSQQDNPGGRRSGGATPIKAIAGELRANSSIPAALSWEEFARQCILAAESSRLNPFSLHPEEYKLLREHITHPQVTIYLNIRNAILRLWTRNPLVYVTVEEAAGCAREKRYFSVAKVAYYWLLRNGYINFGCVEVPNTAGSIPRIKAKGGPRRTVLVIGAGMSGLGCARHLEGLFAQLGDQWTEQGERPPKVIILEGRPRVGGRVYSHPLRDQTRSTIRPGYRNTAEMGAQIVTGYEHGNPLNAIVRGQLGIPYHGLRDNTILYDHDGSKVERSQDILVEKLYNDILERAAVYRHKPATFRVVEGDRNLILFGRDPSDTGGATIATLESSNTPLPAGANTTASTTEEKPSTGVEKLAGRAYQLSAGFNPNIPAAEAVRTMGWQLRHDASNDQSLDLNKIAQSSPHPTLGETMDDGIKQYQAILDLKPKDLRLLNWHHANLEYANAVSVNQLSLSGWDQDIGNEFEGEHSEIIGGYLQVPRGLWQCPSKLEIHFKSVVKSIRYHSEGNGKGKGVMVECTNGEVFEADEVVITTPLGVLKSGSITFEPPLPNWKQDVIERMGFGLLNKVILVYDEAFWEPNRDMFGLLNDGERKASLDQHDYSTRRGRFYLFWNCIKTSGRPMLVALMAGEAAHYAEASSDSELVQEVTDRLSKMFAPKPVPLPSETIVTRWKRDPLACGSYSYVGPKTQAGDYDVMARSHGPLHFAGEATCGTHPATVHGAYLSGLRAAAEVVESMIGRIKVPAPLVEKRIKVEPSLTPVSMEPKHRLSFDGRITQQLRDEDYEASIIGAILGQIGERPIKPGRAGVNPFLLYTKDYWYKCKADCDASRKAATGDPNAKASKTEIRTAIGLMWRTASPEVKKPYLDHTQNARDNAAAYAATFKDRVATWDREAARIRQEYIQAHPPPTGNEDMMNSRTAIELGTGKRLRRLGT